MPALPQSTPPKPPPTGATSVNRPAGVCTSRIAYMWRVRNWFAFETYVEVRENTLMSPDQPMRSLRCGQSSNGEEVVHVGPTRFDHSRLTFSLDVL